MNTTTSDGVKLDADRYLKELTPHLAALPPEERAELLEDLAQHLREIAAEPGPPLAERLGSPEAYAAELLATAGVPAGRPRSHLAARVTALAERVRATGVGREIERLDPVLRPAWWVIRGYLVVSLFSALEQSGSFPGFPLPRLLGSSLLGLLGVLVAVPLSVRLGQRRFPPAGRLAMVAGNVVLAVFALSLLSRAGAPEVRYVIDSYAPYPEAGRGCLATATGQRITNLYAYDTEGRLLDPVLLYDQNGQPIDNLCPEFDDKGRRLFTEYRQDANGAPVINAFPRRQSASVEPGPHDPSRPRSSAPPEATVPVRPPAVVVPRLAPSTTATTAPSG